MKNKKIIVEQKNFNLNEIETLFDKNVALNINRNTLSKYYLAIFISNNFRYNFQI